ncbi:MAG: thioredoxin family protein [Phycisphaerae bacterium]
MRTKLMLASLLALSLAALGADNAPATAKLGAPAPGFTLDDQTGKPVSLSDFSGKIVVLTWLNRDCPFVQRHLKAHTFNNLNAKYMDKGVILLGIDSSHTHTTEGNAKTVKDYSLTFPLLNDAKGNVGHMYDAKTTPEVYIVNKDGTLVYQGAIDNNPDGNTPNPTNYAEQALDQLLAGKSISTPETKSYGCSVKYAQ